MDKGITYEEEELKKEVNQIYHKLDNITTSLAMLSEQLDGKRENLDSGYIKGDVMKDINRIVELLNEFGINSEKLPAFNLNEIIKGLEKIAKEDLY